MPTILLVRHAQASFGAADYDVLSELGREQTGALVAGLERRGVSADRVVSGSLRRQLDTAGPCAAAAGLEVEVDGRFDEYHDTDVLEHHTASHARLERRPGEDAPPLSSREFQTILDDGLRSWVAAGEGGPASQPWPAFLGRVTDGLRDVAHGLDRGQTALVVSSSGVIAALSAELLGLPPEAFVALNHVSVNTAITKVVVGRGGTTLVSYNDHAHLEEAGTGLITYR
jgi:broad specificity phosphatase PhoE